MTWQNTITRSETTVAAWYVSTEFLSRYRIGQERFVEKASIEPTEILNNSTSQILLLVFVFMTLMAIFYGKKFLATSDMQLRKQAVTLDGLVLSYSRAKVILTEQERMALWRLIQDKEQEANRAKSNLKRGW